MEMEDRWDITNNCITCTTCKIDKELKNFYKNNARLNGYDRECKDCASIRRRKKNKTARVNNKATTVKIFKENKLLHKKWNTYYYKAKEKKQVFSLTPEEFHNLITMPCYYCNYKSEPFGGIDRVNSNLGYIISNCVPCCKICNTMKLNYELQFFYEHIEKILNYKNNKNST